MEQLKKLNRKNNISRSIRAMQFLAALCCLCCSMRVIAQPSARVDSSKLITVVLERANEVAGGEFVDSTVVPPYREDTRSAIGNVLFRETTTAVECDTAVQFLLSRKIRVVGNVRIARDSVLITGYEGFYFPDERRSELRKDVALTDTKVYLSSERGVYYANDQRAVFSQDVVLQDSLNVVLADSLVYFRRDARSVIVGKVRILNAADNVRIKGGYAEHFNARNYSFIQEDPVMIKIDSTSQGTVDTLTIRALRMDSFRSDKDSVPRIVIKDSVRIRRGELAAKSINAVYRLKDQKIILYGRPIVWYEGSQLTGDSIVVQLKEQNKKNRIDKVFIYRNAFLVSKDSLDKSGKKFSQVSGNDMVITFDSTSKILRADVYKQALSLYYAYDGTKPRGANVSSGDGLSIFFEDNRVKKIIFRGDVEGEQYPERLLGRKDLNLPGFQWRISEKPNE